MRISDWSSDVCSSDLDGCVAGVSVAQKSNHVQSGSMMYACFHEMRQASESVNSACWVNCRKDCFEQHHNWQRKQHPPLLRYVALIILLQTCCLANLKIVVELHLRSFGQIGRASWG